MAAKDSMNVISKTGEKVNFRTRLREKLREKDAKHFHKTDDSSLHSGLIYKGKEYVTHTKLHHMDSAVYVLRRNQKIGFLIIGTILIVSLITNLVLTLSAVLAVLSIIYFLDTLFTLYLVQKNLNAPAEFAFTDEELNTLNENDLPVFTILCPLYKEAGVLGDFIKNMQKIDWPTTKLEILLLLEENDIETIEKAQRLKLPHNVKVMVVPHSMPKTKPKACNYGLAQCTGEYVVIYDAEDKPDPKQLKKAFLAFKNSNEKVVCVQAKLNYFNSSQNLLTKFFTAEYSLWFDVILPGFQSINTVIPLGGTSNIFKTSVLKAMHGWDPFNVTEDCDLGIRLFRNGYQTTIIDSVTLEEANSNVKNWIRQRSRWIKGYFQTYLVHMRNPIKLAKRGRHFFLFQLIIGMRISFILINPILWITTISYFVFNAYVGDFIESLYPAPIYYMAVTSLVLGNFVYLYNYMIGLAKRGRWELIKYVYFVPFYWLLMSFAAIKAFYQLIFNPHHWEKTHHGLVKSKKGKAIEVKTDYLRPVKRILPNSNWRAALEYYSINTYILAFGALVIATQTFFFVLSTQYSNIISGLGFLILLILSLVLLIKALSKKHNGFFKHPKSIAKFINGAPKDSIATLTYLGAGVIANFLNYAYNAYLTRQLKIEDFGIISLAGSFIFISSIPLSALSGAIVKKVAFHLGKEKLALAGFWLHVRKKTFNVSFVFTLIWLIATPFSMNFFNIETPLPFLLIAPIFVLNALTAVDIGYISGLLKFYILSLMLITEAVSKIFLTWLILKLGFVDYIYLTIPGALLASFTVGYYFALKYANAKHQSVSQEKIEFPSKSFVSFIISRFAVISFITLDLLLAKHYLSSYEAGRYAIIALIGKMIFFVGSIVAQPLIPLVSNRLGGSKQANKTFIAIFVLYFLASFSMYLLVGAFGSFTAPILLGEKAKSITHLLPIYGFGILCFALTSFLITYKQVQEKNFYAGVGVILTAIQIITVSLLHESLKDFVNAMTIVGVVDFIVLCLVIAFERHVITVIKNIGDFFDILSDKIGLDEENKNLRILIFNWRDTKHVWSGGAEVYIHEIAKRLVNEGHQVTMVCGNDQLNETHEVIDGVNIVRHGGFYTVYIWAPLYYLTKLRGKYDVIIDSENGIPFFTPLYVRKPIIGIIHHVHQEIIIEQLAISWYLKPVAYLAKILETKLMPLVYRNVQMITVSNSTLLSMNKIGLGKRKSIEIVHPGVELDKFKPGVKTRHPSVLYLGRIKPYKSIEVAIKAVNELKTDIPDIELKIAGFGEHQVELEKLVSRLGLEQNVIFTGHVTEDVKVKLMTEAWAFIYPSLWEGWGISVIEASASGTPVVASNVPGLRDSVSNPHSGYLVEYGNVHGFAEKLRVLLTNSAIRDAFGRDGVEWANNFTWEKSTQKLLDIIRKTQHV